MYFYLSTLYSEKNVNPHQRVDSRDQTFKNLFTITIYMKSEKLFLSFLLLLSMTFIGCTDSGKFSYEEFPNDPLNTKIYTLENGLKVYMTVNKEIGRASCRERV